MFHLEIVPIEELNDPDSPLNDLDSPRHQDALADYFDEPREPHRSQAGEYGWDRIRVSSLIKALAEIPSKAVVHVLGEGTRLTMSWVDKETDAQQMAPALDGGRIMEVDHQFAAAELHRMWRDILPLDGKRILMVVTAYGIQLHYRSQYRTYVALPEPSQHE